MLTLIAQIWSFLRGRPDHPLYRREMAGWAYLRPWRSIKRGCLPLIALLLLSTTACCGLSVLAPTIQGMNGQVVVVFGLLAGLMFGGETLRWITGLAATALTATSISAEIEAETYELLRLTPLPPREIVLAKFGAAFRQVQMPLAVVTAVRAVTLPGMVLWLIYVIYTSAQATAPSYSPALPVPAIDPAPLILPGLAVLGAVLLWFLYYLVEPFISTTLYAALGVFASTLARSRSGGLLAAGGLRLVLAGLAYVLANLASTLIQLLMLPLLMIPSLPPWLEYLLSRPDLLVVEAAGTALLWLVMIVAAQIGMTLLLIHFAAQRAARLPFTA